MKKILFLAPLFALLTACGGGGGGGSAQAPVVEPAKAYLSASSKSVIAGDTVTLNWSSTSSDGCVATGDWSGALGASGTKEVVVNQRSQYGLDCSGAQAQVAVEALAAYVEIHDPAFEAYLVEAGVDATVDGVVSTRSALAVQEMIINRERGIRSLQGLQAFRNLKKLQIEHQAQLTSIDVSSNTQLTWLNVWACPLTSIDVSKNTKLLMLGMSETEITALDVSALTQVVELALHNDSDDPSTPYGKTKGLVSLDLSKNVKLERLYVGYNRLTALDTSANVNLREVWVEGNLLQRLDFSKNHNLSTVIAFDNQLQYLDIRGINRGAMPSRLYTTGNTELTQILTSQPTQLQALVDGGASDRGVYVDPWTEFVPQ